MNKINKTKAREDIPNQDAEGLKAAIKRSQRWAALGLSGTVAMAFALVLLSVSVFYLKDPVLVKNVAYIDSDGRMVVEPIESSVPTIFTSKSFVEACLRNSLNITSEGHGKELEDVRYCYEKNTFDDFRKRISQIMTSTFTSKNIIGGFETSSMDVVYTHDSNSLVPGDSCQKEVLKRFEGAVSCRSFNVRIEAKAINFITGLKTNFPYNGRVDLIVGSRANFINGMQIIMIDI